MKMRESVLSDLNINFGDYETFRNPQYETNIKEARLKMRSMQYLCEPEKVNNSIISLEGKKLGKNFKNILTISKDMRTENILQLIKTNNFRTSFKTRKFDPFSKDDVTKTINIEDQIKILICDNKTSEQREKLYSSWMKEKKKPSYNSKIYLENLLK